MNRAIILTVLVFILFLGCKGPERGSAPPKYNSYSDMSGVTNDEIRADVNKLLQDEYEKDKQFAQFSEEEIARIQFPWIVGALGLLLTVLFVVILLLRKNGEGKRLEGLVEARTIELNKQHTLTSDQQRRAAPFGVGFGG